MYTFPYPIVDSGLFFDLSIMKMSKVETEEGWVLHIEYQLQNRYDASVRIPISIAYTADVITAHKLEGQVAHESIISRSVLDLQRNHIMYGYGGDHHIVFQSSDKRDFRIIFEPTSVNFTSIIINFLCGQRTVTMVYINLPMTLNFNRLLLVLVSVHIRVHLDLS